MRWLVVGTLALAACSSVPARTADVPTPDPKVAVLQAKVKELTAERDTARQATFMMWNIDTKIAGGTVVNLVLPDTFTTHIAFTATTPVRD